MMSAPEMTMERFRQLVAAYGAAPERWPAAERAAAIRFHEGSAEARALADEQAGLDVMLDRLPAEAPSAALIGRVLSSAPERSDAGAGRLAWLFGAIPVWRPAALFAIAVILGVGMGWLQPLTAPASDPVVIDIAAFSFASNGEEEEIN